MARIAPFPPPAHRTGRADLPHPALGEGSRFRMQHHPAAMPRLGHASPPRLLKACTGGSRLASLSIGFPCRFLRPFNFGPFPRRSLPASSVLWADPTPIPAPSVPRGTRVGGCRHRNGSPVLRRLPCRRAVATTPADPSHRIVRGFLTALCMRRRRPSLIIREVGVREICFEACSAFTRVTARLFAESPSCDPLTSKASADSLPPRLFRLLPGGTTNLPDGTFTRWKTTPFHGARIRTYTNRQNNGK